ncbi:unnamed protein product [Mytilus edulis]|uniref:Endonuclease/exonuclease/phosphatase domain-containing protein n=1 Tax=Mytilus edulis TaxID=6550 RepID=A0A8S3TSA9_MYTED|nr:unnamed protein product [Mytilus edulis]
MSDMMWFKLDKNYFGFEKNLFICSMYIPPNNSSYTMRTNCDKQIFEKLEQDITKFSLEGNIALIGDLNAHINVSESDYITNEIDDSLDDFLPINYIADAVLKSRSTEISQNTNSYGKQLIELCISAQLRILNGRTLGDSKGKVTFFNHNGTSIDDYCICSSGFLPSIINFSINKFDPTVSDHCQKQLNIMSQIKRQPPENLKTPLKCIKWSNEYENTFKLNLLKTDFQPIISEIESLAEIPVQNNLSSVEEKINENVSNISSLLYNAAFLGPKRSTFRNNKSKFRKVKKPYYNNECEAQFRALKHHTRKLCKEPWNKQLRLEVMSKKKVLNKLIRKNYRQFRNKMLTKILESNNSSDEFWKTVKTLKKKESNDPSSNIQAKEWFEYFKNLMNTTHDKNSDFKSCTDDKFLNNCNKNLNVRITAEEVLLALKGA